MKMPHWPKPFNLLENEESLQRMQAILAALGNPHLNLPPTVHVAGTNGKGSTIAFLRAMLEAQGKLVHTYTTPHLIEFNERIVLAGQEISDDFLYEACETVRVAAESGGIALGFYEATTAAAFWAFTQVKADFLLLEVGMGGRLDATNIIPAPILTIITTISLDHTKFLGDTIAAITKEKAAIIKRGTKVISSMQHDEAHEIIEEKCHEQGAEFLCFGADFTVTPNAAGMQYKSAHQMLDFSEPALYGAHQFVNAASAIAAAFELGVVSNNIERGLVGVKWASRMERVQKPFVPQGWEFWLDGGHNSGAAYALANLIADDWADKPAYLIFGTTRGRDVADFVGKFVGVVAHIALVKIAFEPNSYEAEEMFKQLVISTERSDERSEISQAKAFRNDEISCHASIQAAVAFLYAQNPEPARILCCGSLFMRGDIY